MSDCVFSSNNPLKRVTANFFLEWGVTLQNYGDLRLLIANYHKQIVWAAYAKVG